jgi:hypothetical protein
MSLVTESLHRAADLAEHLAARVRKVEVKRLSRTLKTGPMLLPGEQHPAVGAPDLIDGIAIEEATI